MSDKYNLGTDTQVQDAKKSEPFKPGDELRTHVKVIDRTGISARDLFALDNQDGMSFGKGNFGEPALEKPS